MTSMLWELIIAGLLLYGLAFLGFAHWIRGPKNALATWGDRRLAPAGHPRLTAPRPSQMRSLPSTGSRATACRYTRDTVGATRRVARHTRR
jgi:hypothetical protein